MTNAYLRFAAMVAASTIVMFLLTYTNVVAVDHVWWSEERFYMALVMGGSMAIVMMCFMWRMYRSVRVNVLVVGIGLMVLVSGLVLSRSQVFVGDSDYMKGMIPHHSIAILTSERARIEDLRVRDLADEIVEAEEREIAEMEWLLEDIARNGEVTTRGAANARPVPDDLGK